MATPHFHSSFSPRSATRSVSICRRRSRHRRRCDVVKRSVRNPSWPWWRGSSLARGARGGVEEEHWKTRPATVIISFPEEARQGFSKDGTLMGNPSDRRYTPFVSSPRAQRKHCKWVAYLILKGRWTFHLFRLTLLTFDLGLLWWRKRCDWCTCSGELPIHGWGIYFQT